MLAGLGPEPLDDSFSVAVLATALTGKRTPIKAALLDQKVVAGLGNIYVSEALFRARISPQRQASSVPGARATRLVPAIKQTLLDAIAAGGSSLRDYIRPDGELGYFQHAWKVYGREGEPCPGVRANLFALVCAGSCRPAAAPSIAHGRNARPSTSAIDASDGSLRRIINDTCRLFYPAPSGLPEHRFPASSDPPSVRSVMPLGVCARSRPLIMSEIRFDRRHQSWPPMRTSLSKPRAGSA